MRVAYFIDNSRAVNWGGQVTSAGMKHLIRTSYPEAEIVPPAMGPLPWGRLKPVLNALNRRLGRAILDGDDAAVDRWLGRLNVDLEALAGIDTVCFNGEGAIHPKSGHLYRLMGLLDHFRRRGAFVAALNQTVNLKGDALAEAVVASVYARADRVAVREPASRRELARLGVEAELVADAAYAVPRLEAAELAARRARFALPADYWCVTGSSAFRRDRGSVERLAGVVRAMRSAAPERAIVHLANTTTDLWVAQRAAPEIHARVIGYEGTDYRDAMAVIAGARAVVGGRQHPNIFAAIYATPFLPLAAHTHKMEGVVELLGYPLPVVQWEDLRALPPLLARLEDPDPLLSAIRLPRIDGIRLTPGPR